MFGIVTKNNSIYKVNETNKTVSGRATGGRSLKYEGARIFQGCPAVFVLRDGRTLTTSKVEKILSALNC